MPGLASSLAQPAHEFPVPLHALSRGRRLKAQLEPAPGLEVEEHEGGAGLHGQVQTYHDVPAPYSESLPERDPLHIHSLSFSQSPICGPRQNVIHQNG